MVGFGNGYRLEYQGEPVDSLTCVTPAMMAGATVTLTMPDVSWVANDIPRTTLTNCPNCGAPLRGKKERCEYCATEF